MSLQPLLPRPSRAFRDAVRDDLIDQLRSKSVRRIVSEKAKAALDHKREKDPFLKRRKWALSLIHSEEEMRAAFDEFIRSLGSTSRPPEPDTIAGEDIEYHPASFWEAIGGINYVGSMGGGIASLSAEDIDWGDQIGDEEFSSQENAQEFANALDSAEIPIPNTGPVAGPDGTWTVHFVVASSD